MAKFYRTAQQYVLNTLRGEILNGLHPANTHLRQEEVAKRLNVSTTPVREAFRDLRAEGLVLIDPNKGVLTRGLTVADVTEIYDLRMILESRLAKLACLHTTAADLALARTCHDKMCAVNSTEEWALVNESFHEQLVKNQASTRLYDMTEALARAAYPYVNLSMRVDRDLMESNNREHAGLLAAYEARDAQAVHDQTRDHLANTKAAVVKYVDDWLSTPVAEG